MSEKETRLFLFLFCTVFLPAFKKIYECARINHTTWWRLFFLHFVDAYKIKMKKKRQRGHKIPHTCRALSIVGHPVEDREEKLRTVLANLTEKRYDSKAAEWKEPINSSVCVDKGEENDTGEKNECERIKKKKKEEKTVRNQWCAFSTGKILK